MLTSSVIIYLHLWLELIENREGFQPHSKTGIAEKTYKEMDTIDKYYNAQIDLIKCLHHRELSSLNKELNVSNHPKMLSMHEHKLCNMLMTILITTFI